MQRVLLTGLSGTGKSTLIHELVARGYEAVDLDTAEWSHWVDVPADPVRSHSPDSPADVWRTRDWLWREDRVRTLLTDARSGPLFVSGCAPNQGVFYSLLEHVVLLTAPAHVLAERLATRTTNQYGKHPDELARVLEQVRTVEPRLRRRATLEIDTTSPLDHVLATILRMVGP